jgi:multiple sugar transport system ATP-binding protein
MYVAGFIGSPNMNFIPGRIEATGDQGKFVFEGGSLDLICPDAKQVTLGQRPEHIHLTTDTSVSWRGEIVLVEPTGADTYVVVKTAVGLMTVRVEPNSIVKVGELTGLTVSSRHNHWFDAKTEARIN